MNPLSKVFTTTAICSLALVPALAKSAGAQNALAPGFYGGLQLGVVGQEYDFTATNGAGVSGDEDDTAHSISGQFGYQQTFGANGYIAAEVGASVDFNERVDITNPTLLSDQIAWRTNYGFQFYVRPGYRVGQKAVIYALIGAEHLSVEIDEREGLSDHFNTDEGVWGYGLGFGVQLAMWESISLRAEYRHVNYGDIDYRSLITTPENRHIEPSRDVFSIGAMFHF